MCKLQQPLWGREDAVNFVLHFEIRKKKGLNAIWTKCKSFLTFTVSSKLQYPHMQAQATWSCIWKHYSYSKRRYLLYLTSQRKIPEDLNLQPYRTSHLALLKHILCRRVLLEKLVVSQLLKNLSTFYTRRFITMITKSIIDPDNESDNSANTLTLHFLKIHFNIIPTSSPRSSPSYIPTKSMCKFLISAVLLHAPSMPSSLQ